MATVKQLKEDAQRRRRRTRTMFGVAGGVFVLLVVLAFMTASAFHSNAAKVSGQSGAAGASASSSASAQPTAAPAHWVTLPANSGWADSDFPTFFPQTPQGAAAMVAASAKYGWTLDQGQDVQAAELYTVPSAQQASVAGADQLPAQLMKAVGVDSSTTPAGLSVTATPVGVQWTAQSTTAVQVSLLVRLNASATGANTTAEAVLAVTTDVVWTSMPGQPGGGDWRMTLSTGRLPTPAAADVGTVAFNTAGWLAITNTGSAG